MQLLASLAKHWLESAAGTARQQGGQHLGKARAAQRRGFQYLRQEVPSDPHGQVCMLLRASFCIVFITSPPIDKLHTVLQAQHLRDLNARGDAEGVIRLFENGRVQSTEASLGEYVKALVKADRLDNTMLARTLQVGRGLSACSMQAPRLGSVVAFGSAAMPQAELTRCIWLLFLQRGAQPSQAGGSYGPGAYQSFASAPAEAMGAQTGAFRMFAGEMRCSCMQTARIRVSEGAE